MDQNLSEVLKAVLGQGQSAFFNLGVIVGLILGSFLGTVLIVAAWAAPMLRKRGAPWSECLVGITAKSTRPGLFAGGLFTLATPILILWGLGKLTELSEAYQLTVSVLVPISVFVLVLVSVASGAALIYYAVREAPLPGRVLEKTGSEPEKNT